MAQTGRPSFSAVETPTYGVPSGRIRPPPDLPEPVRRAFLALVASCPAEQFRACDLELLVRWSEACVTAKEARLQLETGGYVIDGNKPSPWVAIHQAALKNQALLALRLRLGPQSRSSKAPKSKPVSMSYYDLQNLEREANGEDETDAPDKTQ
jgi:hypothetical protein